MKIALVSTFVPFLYGGARNIVEWLEIMLQRAGHEVERVYLPEIETTDTLMPQMAAFQWLDLSAADRVICFRPQAHLVRHPHKILWFIHHIRIFYDLWDDDGYRPIPNDRYGRQFRAALFAEDTHAISEARRVFTNSKVVSERLKRYNDIDSEVLYPPIFASERFQCRQYNDEIVYICRIEHHKRQHLLLEAMALTKTPVKLRVCGASSSDAYAASLQQRIDALGLQDRVKFAHGWISEDEKISLLADCLAAAYLPEDEDSYGYPSIEASHAAKAVITTTDSGGVLELVVDGVNGFVTLPTAEALAAAMDTLYSDRALATRLGKAAQKRLAEIHISWTHVLDRLLV